VSVAETLSAEDAAARGITAVYFVVTPNREQLVELAGFIDGSELRPTVDRVFPVLMWERLSRCGTRMSATMVMGWMVEAGRGGGRPGWSA
jgi:hypothetical protein